MASIYRVDFLDKTNGTKYAEVFDYEELGITNKVNAPGMATIRLKGNHPVLEDLVDYDYIEILWKDPANDIDWTVVFGGIYAYIEGGEPGEVPPYIQIIALDYMIYLNWRIVAWYADTTDRSKFTNEKAETIIKTLVDYNLGPNASNMYRRLSGGVQTGVAIDTDQARGNSLTISCAYRNLLEVLQELAVKGGGDFNFVRTSGNTITFYWYPGQLGTDRTADIVFSTVRGNIENPIYVKNRIDERTIILVGGAGEKDNRYLPYFTSDDYSSSNHKEVFLDARDLTSDDSVEIEDRADAKLDQYKLEEAYTFDVTQVGGCLYGVHYFLGDLVTGINPVTGASGTYKITQVTITFEREGGQFIEVEVTKQ